MRTTVIIVIILFLFASIFLAVFAVKIKSSGPEAGLATNPEETTSKSTIAGESTSSTVSVSSSTASSIQDNTSSSVYSEEKSSQVEKIEIFLDGTRDGGGIFLGEAKYGLPSPETAALYGEKFADSGYSLTWSNTSYDFKPGSVHNLYIYSFIPKFGWDYLRQPVAISGEKQLSPNIKFFIDTPSNGSLISTDTNIGGWAVNTAVPDNPGISSIEFFLDGPKGFGKQIGSASLGSQRADVAQAINNPAYTNCGFNYLLSLVLLNLGPIIQSMLMQIPRPVNLRI